MDGFVFVTLTRNTNYNNNKQILHCTMLVVPAKRHLTLKFPRVTDINFLLPRYIFKRNKINNTNLSKENKPELPELRP